MKFIKPKVYHIATTRPLAEGMQSYIDDMFDDDDGDLGRWATDAIDEHGVLAGNTYLQGEGSDAVIEFAGRLCYRSFKEGLNPNVKKIRKDREAYFANILKSRHGSVLEHVYDTFVIANCSRVFTHELVRHRLCNFSQESLRFVRLDELLAYYPDAFPEAFRSEFQQIYEMLEGMQQRMGSKLIDSDPDMSFAEKKKITSAMRRLAPIGLATSIVVTANIRTWRHIIEMRTDSSAEEEIRCVTDAIARILHVHHPLVFQDVEVSDIDEWKFKNRKV